jgi:N-acetylglucosaminyldiphosphoundecaprenol N-acetyl-beta-D-mannosaminyltransferase
MFKTIELQDYKVLASDVETIKFDKASKVVINTINAHSFMVAKKDYSFKKALIKSDILLPDGEGIVLMAKYLKKRKVKKIAGADIHDYLLGISQKEQLRCFYIGSSQNTLNLMEKKLNSLYNHVAFGFFSPPFKQEFSSDDDKVMIEKINTFKPNILFVGMTAPKQEKWVFDNKDKINANVICSIGAVFDFIAETKKRAPQWVIDIKMEWFYRSLTAWRLTKRYLYSTPLFLFEILKLKYFTND